MSDSIFMQAPATVPEGMSRHSTHRAFTMADSDDPSNYKFNHQQGSVVGTLVPVPSHNGGIKNSVNPFGKIVVGTETKLIDGRLQEVPFTPTWLADAVKKKGATPMAPPPPPTPMPSPQAPMTDPMGFPDLLGDDMAAKAAADAKVVEQAMAYKEQARAAIAQQNAAEQELSGILQSMNQTQAAVPESQPQAFVGGSGQQPAPQPQPVGQPPMPNALQQFDQMMQMWNQMQNHQAVPPQAQPAVQQVPDLNPPQEKMGLDPMEVAPTKVKLSGSFGTSRGMYKFVHMTDEFIVLIYDEEANIFTPPTSQAVFKLSCNGEEHDVYFAGVEFELPFFKCGVQVMIRS